MFSIINSMSVTFMMFINLFVICGCIYYIVKKKNKVFTPIFYLIPLGSVICILYKCLPIKFQPIITVSLFTYLFIFLVSFIITGVVSLKKKDYKNKNQIILGAILIFLGLFMVFVVPIIIRKISI